METSAKDRTNVEEAFLKLIELIIGDKSKDSILELYGVENKDNIKLQKNNNGNEGEKKGCCKK